MADPVIGKLTINFRGICTHFWDGTVPGIPHRVVLVDASQIRPVVIVVNGVQTEDWLMPHIPTIHSGTFPSLPLNALPFVQGGLLMTGSRLTVPNGRPAPDPPAIDGRVRYINFQEGVLPVAGFTDHYSYATDVVSAGRASAFVDLFNGTVEAAPNDQGVVTVTATVYTNGPPIIQVSPFSDPESAGPVFLPLPFEVSAGQPEASVTIANCCWSNPSDQAGETPTNDFLLHLLTNRGGIPRFVKPPVFKPVAPPQRSPEVGLKNLRALGFPLSLQSQPGRVEAGPPGTTESCSDSRYP